MITLLTDFGLKDAYVGMMKGVILGINPRARLVDICHQVPPQNIQAAGFQLATAYPYFPSGTIHLVVIDPGVGSRRKAIAIDLGDALLVGPNNGVFEAVLRQANIVRVVNLDNPRYWMKPQPSSTFHGRDIFAPVAAHLSAGLSLDEVGTALPLEQLFLGERGAVDDDSSCIQSIDHFGNLITDIAGDRVVHQSRWQIDYRGQIIDGTQTYSHVPPGKPLALVGSHGFVEIAVNQGNAQEYFGAEVKHKVRLQCPTST